MSTIVVKTAKRNTTVTRLAVRKAVSEAYSKNRDARSNDNNNDTTKTATPPKAVKQA